MDYITVALATGWGITAIWWSVDHLLASSKIEELEIELGSCEAVIKKK